MKKEGENSNCFKTVSSFPPIFIVYLTKTEFFLVLLAFSNRKIPQKVLTRPVAQYLHTSSLLWKPTYMQDFC